MSMHHHDQIIGAIKHGVLGLITWASSVGVSMVAFDEWLGRISLVMGIIVGVLTAISICRKLWPKK